MVALANRLTITLYEFQTRYTRPTSDGGVSLRELDDYDCVFFNRARGCMVYEDRPRQCRTWPFWRSVTRDVESWDRTARGCPGMNHGPLISAREIAERLACDGTAHDS
jgi:hypothetical protein